MGKKCTICGNVDTDIDRPGVTIEGEYYCFSCNEEIGQSEIIDEAVIIEREIPYDDYASYKEIDYLRLISKNLNTIKNIAVFWLIITIIGIVFSFLSMH